MSEPAEESPVITGAISAEPAGPLPNTGPGLLPFAFAKRFGVLITHSDDVLEDADRVLVACKAQPGLTTLAELKRFARRPLQLKMVGPEEFDALLTSTYSRDASEARQMVEDMGDEMDLASLAESVPETEDLLEKEDDAPIIRLINALLAEAIREGASDIHIETFERELWSGSGWTASCARW